MYQIIFCEITSMIDKIPFLNFVLFVYLFFLQHK